MIIKDNKITIPFGLDLKEDISLWKDRNKGREFDSKFKMEGNYISFSALQAFHDYNIAIEFNLEEDVRSRYIMFTTLEGQVYESTLVTGDRLVMCFMLKIALMNDKKFKDRSMEVLKDVIKILFLGVEKENNQEEVNIEVDGINEVLDLAYEDFYNGTRGDEVLGAYLESCANIIYKGMLEEIEYCILE